jgi:hypothetical protein
LSGLGINVIPLHRGVGCTAAIVVAEQWRRTSRCRGGPTRFRPCRVAGYDCGPVTRGALHPLSGVACTSARGRPGLVELIIRWGCRYDANDEVFVEAINTSCASATSLTARWEDKPACSEPAARGASCSVAGWRCTATVADVQPAGTVVSLCRRPDARRQAVQISVALPP